MTLCGKTEELSGPSKCRLIREECQTDSGGLGHEAWEEQVQLGLGLRVCVVVCMAAFCLCPENLNKEVKEN